MAKLSPPTEQLLPLPTNLQIVSEFTVFPKLPVEMRNKVWKFVAMEPRKIKLFPLEKRRRKSKVPGQSIAPAMMSTSREARSEGLRYYSLCKERAPQEGKAEFPFWGSGIINRPPVKMLQAGRPAHSNKVWVNFAADKFHLSKLTIDAGLVLKLGADDYNFSEHDTRQLKRLIVDCEFFGGPQELLQSIRHLLYNAEELTVIYPRVPRQHRVFGVTLSKGGLEEIFPGINQDFKEKHGLSYHAAIEYE